MIRERFEELGFFGPVPFLSARECRGFLRAVRSEIRRPPLDWDKGYGPVSRVYYEMATNPAILDRVQAVLGGGVLLWGASIQTRIPGAVHPWHSDIESADLSSQTVAVWVGLENTTRESSLLFVPRSHRFGVTIQEVRQKAGRARDATTDEDIGRWSRELDPRSELIVAEASDGEALFFDGRMWHGSNNLGNETRHALLLQYAHPSSAIRIPDLTVLDWPFSRLDAPLPPCILVRGRDVSGVNRLVPAPVMAGAPGGPQLTSRISPLSVPLPNQEGEAWKPFPLFSGSTADLRFSCHASSLQRGHSPHPPHDHLEEELLMVLSGEVEVHLPDLEESKRRLAAGEFVYYPSWFPHTLATTSAQPANYLMFKWSAGNRSEPEPLRFGGFRVADHFAGDEVQGFHPTTIFDGPTAFLRKLQGHASVLSAGAGYEAHRDAYDVAIVVLEGEIETLGQRVEPFGVVFYPAGDPHGMRNPTDRTSRYLVFEFHGAHTVLGSPQRSRSAERAVKNALKRVLPEPAVALIRRLRSR